MKPTEVIDGSRYKISQRKNNYYLFVSDSEVWITAPVENDPSKAERRSALEALCAMVNIAISAGANYRDISKTLSEIDTIKKTVVSEIAESINDFLNTMEKKHDTGKNPIARHSLP